MIISALLDLIYSILSVLLVFDLPELPATVMQLLEQITGYITTGVSLVRLFIGSTAMGVLALLFQLVLLLNAAYFLWSFVFWIIRKVPILNVKE